LTCHFTLDFSIVTKHLNSEQGKFLVVKVKVKLSLCLTKHNTMKIYGRVKVQCYAFVTLALVGGEQSASCFGRFSLRVRVPGAHWMEGWVGPIAILDTVMIPAPA